MSLCCLAFGALLALRGGFDGRDAGGFLARHLVCAVTGRCDRDERRLVAAYGERDAAAVRALAPNLVYEPGERELPVDWRECRRVSCSRGAGRLRRWTRTSRRPRRRGRATAFTHVIRRDGRLYIQYWLYYPDSNTTLAGSDRLWASLLGWRRPVSRIPPRRLGGRVRPRGSGRQHLAPGQLARPLPELQMGVLPRRVGAAHRLGAGLARQPLRPRAVQPRAALAGARAAPGGPLRAPAGSATADPAEARPRPPRAQHHRGGPSARSARVARPAPVPPSGPPCPPSVGQGRLPRPDRPRDRDEREKADRD